MVFISTPKQKFLILLESNLPYDCHMAYNVLCDWVHYRKEYVVSGWWSITTFCGFWFGDVVSGWWSITTFCGFWFGEVKRQSL